MLLGSRTKRTSLVNSTTQTSIFKLGQFLASPISGTFMFASHVNCGCCRLSLIFVTSWRAARVAISDWWVPTSQLIFNHHFSHLSNNFHYCQIQFPQNICNQILILKKYHPIPLSLSLSIYIQNILFEKNLPLSLVVPSSITASANFLTSLDASPGDATKGVPASPASATEGSIGSSKTCSIPKVSLANSHVGWQIPNLRGHRNRKFASKCWCFICKSSTVHFLRNQYYVNHIQPSIPMLTYTTKSTENTQALKPWEEFCRGVRKVQKLDEVEIQYMNCRKFNFPWFLGRRVTMISNDAGICPSVGWHVIKFPWLKYTVICFVLLGLLHGA